MGSKKDDHLDLDGRGGMFCQCDSCRAMRNGFDITKKKEPSQQEQLKDFLEQQKARDAKGSPGIVSNDYCQDSPVVVQRKRIEELVNAHWAYMEKVLSTGQDKQQTFTWEQMMQIRKWDYTSAAAHFYGHGYEDAVKAGHDMERQTQLFKDIQKRVKESK